MSRVRTPKSEPPKARDDTKKTSDELVEALLARDAAEQRVNELGEHLISRTHERDGARLGKDAAYRERNQCVAALARMALANGWRTGLGQHNGGALDPDWDAEWLTVVLIDLPSGQISWHLHDSDVPLFAGLSAYAGSWDGHSTEEKYARLAALPVAAPRGAFGALVEEARAAYARDALNSEQVVARDWAKRVLVAAGEVEP